MAYGQNTLSAIAPILVKDGLIALRENSIMVRLANFNAGPEISQRGSTINVPVPTAIPAQEVNIGTPNTPTAITPGVIPIVMDNWYEATFALSDKEIGDIKPGYLPQQATEAIKSLANQCDTQAITEFYESCYGWTGTAGSTPDATSDITQCGKILNDNLAPLEDRALLLDPAAYAEFQELSIFMSAEAVGNTEALRMGSLGKKYGFEIYMDQNMPYHTKGTLAAQTSIASKAIAAIGATTLTLDDSAGGTLTGTLVEGDLFTFATDTTVQHVITADATASSNEVVITFEPPLKTATADGTVMTLVASHQVNFAFNKNGFCFASRPLESPRGLGTIIESAVDPVSGITLRLEISRPNKQTQMSWDILWGSKTIRREFGCRLVG